MTKKQPPPPNKKIEQNNPKGPVLMSVKPDLMCGGIHQLSIWRPSVIIDSHMHIQSGNCAPLPFLQDRTPVLGSMKLSRKWIEGIGEGGSAFADHILLKPYIGKIKQVFGAKPNENGDYYRKIGVRQTIPVSQKKTLDVGADFIAKQKQVHKDLLHNQELYKGISNLVLSGVLMTMDMEYAHIDGYFGVKVYNAIYSEGNLEKPVHYWYPKHGFWSKRGDSYVRTDEERSILSENGQTKEEFDDYKKTMKLAGISGVYYDSAKQMKFMKIKAAPCLTSKTETDTYEQWKAQLDYTERVALANPLKVLPMFHYDPRRWQALGMTGNTEPFTMVRGKGIFLGFKMYTAQGYRPWDPRLPIMEEFYAKCCEAGIPIMNHCTPDGAPSFDREEYFNFVHPNDTSRDKEQKQKAAKALDYFNNEFVSPDAWRKVLDKTVVLKSDQGSQKVRLNKLHICLAHFGGNSELGRKWNKQIIDMIKSGKYPNLYTDISSSFANKEFRNYFKEMITTNPKIKKHILFGTDWYLTLLDAVDYVEYFQKAKAFLDEFDTSLWPYFTQYNPYRFYRLEKEIGRIAENIIIKRATPKIREVLPKLDPADKIEIRKDAACIKVANKGHINYEESP